MYLVPILLIRETEYSVVCLKPWIEPDGTLNKRVLERFLGGIIQFLLAYPGSSLNNIAKQFCPSLSNIQVYDLIQVMPINIKYF